MDRAIFWAFIDDTRFVGDGDPARHAGVLRHRLESLPPGEIVAFEHLWRTYDAAAYHWDLWAAAYLLNGGCDDECFDHFRSYVIGLGEVVYREALADADSLVFLAERGPGYQFAGDARALATVAADAYEAATGEPMPEVGPPLPEEPHGVEWDVDRPEVVVPRIAAAVGWLEA